MRILFNSAPATRHLDPLLAITRILLAEGHEITFLTDTTSRPVSKAVGPNFFRCHRPRISIRKIFSRWFPELKSIPPGPEWLRIVCEWIFVEAIPAQYHGLWQALDKFATDVIVGDDMFFGVLPMLLGRAQNGFLSSSAAHRFFRRTPPSFVGGRGACGDPRRHPFMEFCHPAAKAHEVSGSGTTSKALSDVLS
jgi:hypothetical protein